MLKHECSNIPRVPSVGACTLWVDINFNKPAKKDILSP